MSGDDGSLDERVDRLESGQQTLSEKLDKILGIVSSGPPGGTAENGTTGPAGRPPDIGEQVRAELARAEQERADKDAAEAEKSDRETIREQLAKLREAAPRPPQRRSERMMWGAR